MKNFFYYNKSERQGLFLFLALFAIAFIFPKIYGHYYASPSELSWKALRLDSVPAWINSDSIKGTIQVPTATHFFPFDPNKATQEEFTQLGLSERTSKTILNFRSKGGRFYKKKDLLKIYGLDSTWYNQVASYIEIPNNFSPSPTKPKSKPIPRPKSFAKAYTRKTISININEANAEQWAKLYGIGPVLSSRIVKFRDKLGGFYQIAQVNETYGLPDSTFQKIRPQLLIHTPLALKPLAINQLEVKNLAAHPYIDWKKAHIIARYKEQHGPFADFAALQEIHGLEEEWLERLRPYLSFE